MKNRFPTFWHYLVILILFILFQIPLSIPAVFLPEYKSEMFLFIYSVSMVLTIWAVRKIYHKKSKWVYQPDHLKLLPVIIVVTYLFFLLGNFSISLLPEPSGIFKEIYDKLQAEMKSIFSNKITAFLALSVADPFLKKLCSEG